MSNSSNSNNNEDSSPNEEQNELKDLNNPRSAIEQSIELGSTIFYFINHLFYLFRWKQ